MLFKIKYAANKTGEKNEEIVEFLSKVEAERFAFNLAISEYHKQARTNSNSSLKSLKSKTREDADYDEEEHILNTIWYTVDPILPKDEY